MSWRLLENCAAGFHIWCVVYEFTGLLKCCQTPGAIHRSCFIHRCIRNAKSIQNNYFVVEPDNKQHWCLWKLKQSSYVAVSTIFQKSH